MNDTLEFVDPPRRRAMRKVAAVAAVAIYGAYLAYRGLYTLNPEAIWFSLAVYVAEVHGFFSLVFYYFQIWELRRRRVPTLEVPLTVDAFVTTYDEDVELLRQTVRAVIAMRHPHRTLVLDDGRRSEVAALCAELGCEYVTRPDNRHAKAGNWNHAFARTSADVIATFDADHVPRADFLERTLGFFNDPKVAFVQVPQRYHNLDSLQHRVSWRTRRLYGEQDVFFNLVMPGKDHWNAAFFCGTGAVLRREALEPFGGLLTGTITEDMHTSLALQAAGWTSVYLNELLVTGLAPMDLSSYHTQRLRWAEGNLRIIRHLNPLTCRGLSFAQRMCYFASMYHWTIGFAKLVFYMAPPLILFTGQFPIAHFDQTFLLFYAAHLLSLVVSYKVMSRGTGRLLMDELFNMANFFTLLVAAKRFVFGRGEGRFVVTSKRGSDARQERAALPQFLLTGLTVASLVWSGLGLGFGATEDLVGIGIAMFWAVYNLVLTVVVVGFAFRPPQRRQSVRFKTAVPVQRLDGDAPNVGLTLDVSEGGCTLLWPSPLAVGDALVLQLHFGTHAVKCRARIRADYGMRESGWVAHGVEFTGLRQHVRDKLADAIYNMTVPELFARLSRPAWLVRRWRSLAWSLVQGAPPRAARREAFLPVRVADTRGSFLATTRDMSATGLAIVSPRPMPVGSTVQLELMSASGTWTSAATVCRVAPIASSHPTYEVWHVGLRIDAEPVDVLGQILAPEAA